MASLYPEVVSAEYCLHDCRGAIVGLEGAIVGLEQVPIDAERDRARAVPEFHICAIEIHSARTRSSVAASARAAMRNLLPTLAWSGKAVHLSSSPRTGSREDSAGLGGASRLPGVLSWAAGRDGVAARAVTAHQLTESQQATTSPKTPAATSQPSDGQWDCNFIISIT